MIYVTKQLFLSKIRSFIISELLDVRITCRHGRAETCTNTASRVSIALHMSCVTCLNSINHPRHTYKSMSHVNKTCSDTTCQYISTFVKFDKKCLKIKKKSQKLNSNFQISKFHILLAFASLLSSKSR